MHPSQNHKCSQFSQVAFVVSSYNLQLTVDYDSGIILANTVTQDPADPYQLIPQIEQTIEAVGPLDRSSGGISSPLLSP